MNSIKNSVVKEKNESISVKFGIEGHAKEISEKIIREARVFIQVYKELIKGKNAYEIRKDMVTTTQFSNLLRNVKFASCVEEMELFLKYQEAKDPKNSRWAMVCNFPDDKGNIIKTLAGVLLYTMKKVEELAKTDIEDWKDSVNKKIEKDSDKQLEIIYEIEEDKFLMRCIEKLMGYCYWSVYSIVKLELDKG